MVLLGGILLTLAALLYVVSPLVNRMAAPLTDGPDRVAELRELYALRDVAYETLRDLEFDFHAGKIDRGDYDELSARFRQEAILLVTRIEALERPTAAADQPARGGS